MVRNVVVPLLVVMLALSFAPTASAIPEPVEANECIGGGTTVTILGEDVLTCFVVLAAQQCVGGGVAVVVANQQIQRCNEPDPL